MYTLHIINVAMNYLLVSGVRGHFVPGHFGSLKKTEVTRTEVDVIPDSHLQVFFDVCRVLKGGGLCGVIQTLSEGDETFS